MHAAAETGRVHLRVDRGARRAVVCASRGGCGVSWVVRAGGGLVVVKGGLGTGVRAWRGLARPGWRGGLCASLGTDCLLLGKLAGVPGGEPAQGQEEGGALVAAAVRVHGGCGGAACARRPWGVQMCLGCMAAADGHAGTGVYGRLALVSLVTWKSRRCVTGHELPLKLSCDSAAVRHFQPTIAPIL